MLELEFHAFPELCTSRLLLRNYQLSDASALFAMRNNESVMQFIPRPRPSNIADVVMSIESMIESNANFKSLVWAIAPKEEPEKMIGSIGYYRTNFENYGAEVGYMLDQSYWRKGIIAEGLNEVIRFGFEEMRLHRISANIDPQNNASRQLLLKNGFVREANFREDFYFDGKFLDSEIYGLIVDEWQGKR